MVSRAYANRSPSRLSAVNWNRTVASSSSTWRIIRQVGEDEAAVTFQFTSESRDGDRFEYALETMLTLDKKTGTVTCDLPGLATLAQ